MYIQPLLPLSIDLRILNLHTHLFCGPQRQRHYWHITLRRTFASWFSFCTSDTRGAYEGGRLNCPDFVGYRSPKAKGRAQPIRARDACCLMILLGFSYWRSLSTVIDASRALSHCIPPPPNPPLPPLFPIHPWNCTSWNHLSVILSIVGLNS